MDPLAIAETLRDSKPDLYDWSSYNGQEADTAIFVWEQIVERFAQKLAEQDKSFDYSAFYRMAGRTR